MLRCKTDTLSENDTRSICEGRIFSAVDKAEDPGSNITKNLFELSWAPVENGVCISNATGRAMKCSTTLASYEVRISTLQNGTQTIESSVISEREFWDQTMPLNMTVLRSYFKGSNTTGFHMTSERRTNLTADFLRLQAYSIRQAALIAIKGSIDINPTSSEFSPNLPHT